MTVRRNGDEAKEPEMSVVTEGGLFPHYDAAVEVDEPTRKSSEATPAKLLETPPRARAGGRSALATAVLAAGTVRLLGDAVDAYNRRIDELNARWRAAKRENFGVGPLDVKPDASEAEIRRAAADHAERLLDAKLELLADLEREHQRIRRELDRQIEAATARLENGPTEDVLRDITGAGALRHLPRQRRPDHED